MPPSSARAGSPCETANTNAPAKVAPTRHRMTDLHRSATAAEARDVGCRRIWMVLQRTVICHDALNGRISNPAEQSRHIQVLVRVHFDIVDLGIAGHRRVGRLRAGEALRPDAGRTDIGEVDTP